MEGSLVALFYLARPLTSIKLEWDVLGFSFFDLSAIVFTCVLGLASAGSAISKSKHTPISSIEWAMVAFIGWCTMATAFNYDVAVFRDFVRWTLPFFTFMILRRSFRDKAHVARTLMLTIVSFSIPLTLSAALISQGAGIGKEIYLTGVVRYRGAYNGSHELAHNLGFLIMLMVAYVILSKHGTEYLTIKMTRAKYVAFSLMGMVALYCIYQSQTRTVIVGLLLFSVICLYFYNKKALGVFSALLFASVIAFASIYVTVFYDVVNEKGEVKTAELEKSGSGRPIIWKHNFEIFMNTSLVSNMIGVGIGNYEGNQRRQPGREQIWPSHNDWLSIMLEAGIIGFVIVVWLYLAILSRVLMFPGREKYVFLAIWVAVVFMNFSSNSYLSRVSIAQLFFMLFVYLDIPDKVSAKAIRQVRNQFIRRGEEDGAASTVARPDKGVTSGEV